MESTQLTLSVQEINLILESLGQHPYVTVHQLIARIQRQAESQLEPKSQPIITHNHKE